MSSKRHSTFNMEPILPKMGQGGAELVWVKRRNEEEEQEDLVAKISCVSKDGIAAHGPTHLPVHKYQQGGPTEFVPEMNLS